MDISRKDWKTKTGVFLIITALFLSPVLAAQTSFTRGNVLAPANNSEVTVSGLKSSTNYNFKGIKPNGETVQIQSFTTGPGGSATFQFIFKPYKRGLNISATGFRYGYYINGNLKEETTLSPAYLLNGLDTFYDNTVNTALWQARGGVSESNSVLKASRYSDNYVSLTYAKKVSPSTGFQFFYKITGDTSSGTTNFIAHTENAGSVTVKHNIGYGKYVHRYFYFNKTVSRFQLWNSTQLLAESSVVTKPGKYSLELDHIGSGYAYPYLYMDGFMTAPVTTLKYWEETDKRNPWFKPGAGTLNYTLKYYNAEGTPGIEWATRGTSKSQPSNLAPDESIAVRNTGNGSINYAVLKLERPAFYQDLKPKDNYFTTRNTIEFSFINQVKYIQSLVSIQFWNGTGWETQTAEWRDVVMEGNDCIPGTVETQEMLLPRLCSTGNKIIAEVDVTEYAGENVKWRFKIKDHYTDKYLLTPVRQFYRFVPEAKVKAFMPRNGYTYTSLKPFFYGYLKTKEPGELKLYYDNRQIHSWNFGNSYTGPVSFKPSTGLTNGQHYYSLNWTGESGFTKSTEVKHFTINTSKAENVNITLNSPVNGTTVKETNVVLNATVESTESGTAKFFINEILSGTRQTEAIRLIESQGQEQIKVGVNHLKTELINPEIDNYGWYITVNASGVLYQSRIESFKVAENVEFTLEEPNKTAQISKPPVVFNAELNASNPGTAYLVIDGKRRENTATESGVNQLEFKVEKLSKGKHSWRIEYKSDTSGKNYRSGARTFQLKYGTVGEKSFSGVIASTLTPIMNNWLGTSTATSLTILAILVTLTVSVPVAFYTDSLIGVASAVLISIGFYSMGWLPQWIALVYGLIATGVVVWGVTKFAGVN